MREMTECSTGLLPQNKPRYLMGVGTPLDIIESVALGVDMLTVLCQLVTQETNLFTSQGRINIKIKHEFDESPLDWGTNAIHVKTLKHI